MKLNPFAACVAALLATHGIARADEGMWTFDNFPAAAVKAKYGVTVDQAWLDHVRSSTGRLSTGCSASIVSGQGLVLTNHHCVRACAQDLSTPDDDYIKDGYVTAGREEERKCAGMQLDVLATITDVTDQIAKATAGQSGDAFVKARDGATANIEKTACAGKEEVQTCEVVNLYQGGQYKLYTYHKYSDLRLVFAPEESTAFFGGDPDNFNFPRYDLDVSFVRVYENGKPAATPQHLHWNAAAPKDGEPVFVAGNPGSTSRLLTADQLHTVSTFALPLSLVSLSERRGRYIIFGEQSAENARISNGDLFSIENSFKAFYGQLQALFQPGFLESKAKADMDLKAKVAADPKLAAATGDPWSEIARAEVDNVGLGPTYIFLEGGAGSGSRLYSYARSLVRAAQERAKPNADRLIEFSDARLPIMKKRVLDERPVYASLEELKLEFWLTKVREYLTADAPQTKVILGKDSPEDLAAKLSQSTLGDAKVRQALWDGGLPAINASTDPMIKFVLATDPQARAARKDYEQKVIGPSDRAAQRIAAARFAIYGTNVYPDATFTPRLSYGKVAGWTDHGRTYPAFTNFKGLWARVTGKFPFAVTPRWTAAQGKLKDSTVFDFVTTNDIIGGNSGSPMINAKGEVIGAVFDGNILSLGGDFAFDENVNRTVAVSTAAATEALQKVYGQTALVQELTAP